MAKAGKCVGCHIPPASQGMPPPMHSHTQLPVPRSRPYCNYPCFALGFIMCSCHKLFTRRNCHENKSAGELSHICCSSWVTRALASSTLSVWHGTAQHCWPCISSQSQLVHTGRTWVLTAASQLGLSQQQEQQNVVSLFLFTAFFFFSYSTAKQASRNKLSLCSHRDELLAGAALHLLVIGTPPHSGP